jgi:phospholipid/cholesterol/gamma-HCH transport system ATP-binding protein
MITQTNDQRKSVVVVKGLRKSFGENHVLRDFDAELKEGENLVVLGKSGSGKSVLIKCIIGLMQAEAGTIKVLDQEVEKLSQDELDQMRVKVGFLFQSNALYDSMTVRENLEFPLRRHRKAVAKGNVNDLIMEALKDVGLEDTIDLLPEELSGGMKKRIALARTLILKPSIILYDEPTTGLDPITAKGISNLILDVQKKYNTSSIIISHDVNCVKIVANRILLLYEGRSYATGTYDELSNSADEKVKQFFD